MEPVQFGNQQSSRGEGEREGQGSGEKSQSVADTKEADQILLAIIENRLGGKEDSLPPSFEIYAAGSFARRELVPSSDLDIFFVIPDEAGAEKVVFLKARFLEILTDIKEKTGRGADDESSGKLGHILMMDQKGGMVRDCRLLHRQGEASQGQALVKREGPVPEALDQVLKLIAGALVEYDKGKHGSLDVKIQLYRPLHLFIRIMAQAHGLTETNSAAIVRSVMSFGSTALLELLLRALGAVEVLRRGGVVSLDGHEMRQNVPWLKKLYSQVARALKHYGKTKEPKDLSH